MINVKGFDGEPTELSRDMLPIKGYQIYNCNDYRLGMHACIHIVKYSLIKQSHHCICFQVGYCIYVFLIESEAGECTYYIVAPMAIIEAKVNTYALS